MLILNENLSAIWAPNAAWGCQRRPLSCLYCAIYFRYALRQCFMNPYSLQCLRRICIKTNWVCDSIFKNNENLLTKCRAILDLVNCLRTHAVSSAEYITDGWLFRNYQMFGMFLKAVFRIPLQNMKLRNQGAKLESLHHNKFPKE